MRLRVGSGPKNGSSREHAPNWESVVHPVRKNNETVQMKSARLEARRESASKLKMEISCLIKEANRWRISGFVEDLTTQSRRESSTFNSNDFFKGLLRVVILFINFRNRRQGVGKLGAERPLSISAVARSHRGFFTIFLSPAGTPIGTQRTGFNIFVSYSPSSSHGRSPFSLLYRSS